jgi:hypothetical protein
MVTKKPRLTIVKPASAKPNEAPPSLHEAGATLWQSVTSEYNIDDAGGREMLLQICRAADRAAECAATINEDGPVFNTKHGLKEHPLLKLELASRSFVVRGLHRLGLDIEPTRDAVGRPPGTFNRKR